MHCRVRLRGRPDTVAYTPDATEYMKTKQPQLQANNRAASQMPSPKAPMQKPYPFTALLPRTRHSDVSSAVVNPWLRQTARGTI
jgi:hypothetical protein